MIEPPRIDELDWDDWNLEHIKKHKVSPEEVAEIHGSEATYEASYQDRIKVVGPAKSGRMLVVIIGASPYVPHRWYVFSARPASRKERAGYHASKEGNIP